MAGIGAKELLILFGFLYVLPSCIALVRDHPNKGGVIIVNLLLGWTFIGWVAALVWALLNQKPAASSAATATSRNSRPCPECAELILPAARKCKHCGSAIEPIKEPDRPRSAWSGD